MNELEQDNGTTGLYRFGYLNDGCSYGSSGEVADSQFYLGFRGIPEEELEYLGTEDTGIYTEEDMISQVKEGYVFVPGPYCLQIFRRRDNTND